MRKMITDKAEVQQIQEVICNRCGKKIRVTAHGTETDVLHVEHCWGYFSGKDGERHTFDLCEQCYDEIVKTFHVPVEIM